MAVSEIEYQARIKVLEDEIQQYQELLHRAESSITTDERQLILDLLREARLQGLIEIQYKALRLRISPQAAEHAQKTTVVQRNGAAITGWETTLPSLTQHK